MTLADLVEEYLGMYQAEPVTITKLRWLLVGNCTAVNARPSTPSRRPSRLVGTTAGGRRMRLPLLSRECVRARRQAATNA